MNSYDFVGDPDLKHRISWGTLMAAAVSYHDPGANRMGREMAGPIPTEAAPPPRCRAAPA